MLTAPGGYQSCGRRGTRGQNRPRNLCRENGCSRTLLCALRLCGVTVLYHAHAQDSVAVSVLRLRLLLVGVLIGRANDDDFIVIRLLVSRSGTTGDSLTS